MGSLPRELASRLSVSCGIEVEKVHIEAGGVVVTTHGGDFLHARAAVLATRAGEAAEIWPAAPDPVRRFLTTQPYTQGFGAFLRTSERVERLDRRGRSVLMDILPSSGGHGALLAAVYFNELAPSGGLVGLAATPEASRSGAAAEELAAGLESEFREMHAESPPEVTARLSLRWPIFVPWYPVGRARQLASLRSGLAPGPIQLAGDYLYGPLMEGAVRAGEAAAGRANLYLS
jgi:oxygen-dependent protoporphyrinogen oxidase